MSQTLGPTWAHRPWLPLSVVQAIQKLGAEMSGPPPWALAKAPGLASRRKRRRLGYFGYSEF